MKLIIYRSISLLLIVGILSFIPNGAKAEASKKNKTLHLAIASVFNRYFDPVDWNIIRLQPFFSSIYSPLFKLDKDFHPYPFLVDKFDRKGKSVIFTIKEKANFSDGSPITADDVIYTIEYGIKADSFVNPIYKVIEGGIDFFNGKTPHCPGLKILGPKQFEIKFSYENVDFGYYMASCLMGILNKDRNHNSLVFSGAMMVEEYIEKKDETIIRLKPNPWYLGKKSNIENLWVHFYWTQEKLKRTIYMGEPDLFFYSLYGDMPESRFKYNYFKMPPTGAFYFKLNTQRYPFKDKHNRQIFQSFISSLNLAGKSGWELTIPAKLVLPYGLTGYFIFNHIQKKDIKDFLPLKPFKIKCMSPDVGFRKILFPIIAKQLKKYGIDFEIDWQPLDVMRLHERKGDIDLATYFHNVDIPLSYHFYESEFLPGHELNIFGNIIPEANTLLDSYLRETDEIKKLKILASLEAISQDEAFLIPFVTPLSLLGYKPNVKGVSMDQMGNMCIEEIDVN